MYYSMFQWLMFFFIYCFIGWIWECSYVSIRTRKLTNRGFMRGPFLPIYGSGAIVMLIAGRPLMEQPVIMFFAGLICASTLEYLTGAAMERLFKVRYWDYSECFLNIKGHICLKASLAWGTFTLGMNYYVHKPIERAVLDIPAGTLEIIVIVLLVYFTADYSLSFKTAMDLRDVIIAMEKFKEEIALMERRLDVAIAFAEDSKEQAIARVENSKEEAKRLLTERMESLEQKLEHTKEILATMDIAEGIAEEIAEKKAELDEKREHILARREEFMAQVNEYKARNDYMKRRFEESARRRGVLYRNMIRNNPIISTGFKESVEEIKAKVNEYIR